MVLIVLIKYSSINFSPTIKLAIHIHNTGTYVYVHHIVLFDPMTNINCREDHNQITIDEDKLTFTNIGYVSIKKKTLVECYIAIYTKRSLSRDEVFFLFFHLLCSMSRRRQKSYIRTHLKYHLDTLSSSFYIN